MNKRTNSFYRAIYYTNPFKVYYFNTREEMWSHTRRLLAAAEKRELKG